MAPLSMLDMHDHVFSNAQFIQPLQLQLREALHVSIRPERRVTFCQDCKTLNPQREFYTDDDVHTKWYTMDELSAIKSHAKALSKELLQAGSSKECDLTMAHRKTTLMLVSDFKALIKLTPTAPDQDLRKWCSRTDGRRGLERFSSKDYSCFRRRDVIKSRTAVLTEQQRQRELGISDTEAIARVTRLSSRRSRTFSLFFGEADAAEIRTPKGRECPLRRAPPPRKRSKTC